MSRVAAIPSVLGIWGSIRLTAGQITSAAAIMVGVFATFALGRDINGQQFGVGLGVAVLIDATIIRSVLLPATMKLLADWNWYLPKWLEWLPRVGVGEGTGEETRPARERIEDIPHRPALVPIAVHIDE